MQFVLTNNIYCIIKGALYRIQIVCRRYTFWSYPAGLTIADPPGKQKLMYRRVYSHHFHTTIPESIHTTPNSIQCPFNCCLVCILNIVCVHERYMIINTIFHLNNVIELIWKQEDIIIAILSTFLQSFFCTN